MDNLRILICIRGMDRVPNAMIRKLCRMKKGRDERIGKRCAPVVWPYGEDGE